ncbi:MAG TPA: protein kinase [Anaerolineales bacterium]|nr:protein kinase [Anaerolineales bacterium]
MTAHNWVGKSIGGRYRIEALLGQGGMSAVYRATDPNLRRTVAIKLIHAHLSSDPNFVGRFKEEAAAVARLRHPNIVQVHDFNIDGETYYMVMEYLVGETLQARLKRLNATGRHMPLDEALRLCLQVCEAAGYAHNHELVHRDIKPANIMLNVNNQAILMDFGIVKIIGGDYHTATGATIGTAMYMSPEQIRSERIDDRADIYSLGVTLYEMISGRPPYTADSALTLMMMVLNDPLPALGESRPGLPDSLLRAVHKALAKEPAERYQTMAEMAAGLRGVQAELASAPPAAVATVVEQAEVEALPPSAAPPTVPDIPPETETAGVLLAGAPAVVASQAGLQQPGGAALSAPAMQDEPLQAAPVQASPGAPRERLISRMGSRRTLLSIAGLLVLAIVVAGGWMYLNSRRPPGVQLSPISLPPDLINAQTARGVVNLGSWETASFIDELAYSPDGSLLGTANDRDWVRFSSYRYYGGLWRVEAGSLQNYLLGHTQWVYDVAFSPDGLLLGTASDDGRLMLWQVADGSLVRQIESSYGGLTSLAFSPNNLLLAAGSWDGVVGLWQVNNGNLLRTLKEADYSVKDIDFSPDGKLLAAASDDNAIRLWQVSDGSLLQTLQGHTAPAYEVVFSADGTLLASASEDQTIKLWQVSDGSLQQSIAGHREAVYDVAFSPDGSLLASGSGDGTLRLWQVSDGALLSTLLEYDDGIKSVAFSPDGHLLVSAAANGVVQFWGISAAIPLDGN